MLVSEMLVVKGRIKEFAGQSDKFASVDIANEARKYVDELEDTFEDVDEGLKRRIAELESDLEKADSYGTFYEVRTKCVQCLFSFQFHFLVLLNETLLFLAEYVELI